MTPVPNTPGVPVSKITVQFDVQHVDWLGDGRDEQIMVDALKNELRHFCNGPTTTFSVVEVVTETDPWGAA